jgi:hypothetical protein
MNINKPNLLSFTLLFFILIISNSQSAEDEVDIKAIDMFPQDYNHKIYAGFLNITDYQKSLYYFFF